MILKEGGQDILSYLEDSSNLKGGNADKVFIPENEHELEMVLSECAGKKMSVTVSGGGTGTVGGRVSEEGAIVSMERFGKILRIDSKNKTALLQAGVVIKDFLQEISDKGFFYPPFPTERTAFIGGNVATNASGEYSFKFGPTRKYVQKLKMALTTGKTLEIERGSVFEKDGVIDYGELKVKAPSYRTPCIKCAAGYFFREGMDGIDLLIGSEGTLGIITEVEVSLIDALPPNMIVIAFLQGEENIPEVAEDIKQSFPENLYCLEFFDKKSLAFLQSDFPGMPKDTCAIYAEAPSETSVLEKWDGLLEKHKAVDAWLGEDRKNYERLIDFRHRLPENINAYFKKMGIVKVAMDIAVPEDRSAEMYGFYREMMNRESLHSILFGHLGESHLHFNLFPSGESESERALRIYEMCVEKALSLGGSVAAEHGIGKLKHKWLLRMYGEDGLKDMVRIKKTFDPHCILGRNNIFPKSFL